MPNDTDHGQHWRVLPGIRAAWVFVLLAWLALTLGVTIDVSRTPGAGASPAVLLWAAMVLIAFGVWRLVFVPYVEATGTDLVVRNAFSKQHIPWSEIKTVSPGTLGLTIVMKRDGPPKTAWAVQKGRRDRRTRVRVQAEEATEALMTHVRSAGS